MDLQPSAVHIQRTVGQHIRSIDEVDLNHLDRVLLPILQYLTREQLPEARPCCWPSGSEVLQGRVRLQPEVRKLLWYLVECWQDLVRSQGSPKVPASTHWLEG